jgi:hypothetical protein
VPSTPIRIQGGVATAFTERTTARARVGYAKGNYDEGADFSGMIGGVELGFRYSPLGRVLVAYERNFQDSINANFYKEHVGRVSVDQQLGLVYAQAALSLHARGYRGVPMAIGGDEDRDDTIVRAHLGGRYMYRDWMAVTADYTLSSVDTEFRSGGFGMANDPSYVRHVLMAGVRAAF